MKPTHVRATSTDGVRWKREVSYDHGETWQPAKARYYLVTTRRKILPDRRYGRRQVLERKPVKRREEGTAFFESKGHMYVIFTERVWE